MSHTWLLRLAATPALLLLQLHSAPVKLRPVFQGQAVNLPQTWLLVNVKGLNSNSQQEWTLGGSISSADFNQNPQFVVGENLTLIFQLGDMNVETKCCATYNSLCSIEQLNFTVSANGQALRALITNKSSAVLLRSGVILQTFRIESLDYIVPEGTVSITPLDLTGSLRILGASQDCPAQILANWSGSEKAFAKHITLRFQNQNPCRYESDSSAQPFMRLKPGNRSELARSHTHDSRFVVERLHMFNTDKRKTVKVKHRDIH